MKIRIYSPLFPFPPDEGNLLTVFDQACSLAMDHEVELVSWMNTGKEVNERKQRVSPLQPPASLRLRALAGIDGRTGGEPSWRKIYRSFADDTASAESHFFPQWPLRLMSNDPSVDLEIFHHTLAYPWLVGKPRSGSSCRVCMVHDIASQLYRHRSLDDQSNGLARWYHNFGAGILEKHEARLGDLVDELWFVSPMEMERFRQDNKMPRGRVTSPTFDVKNAQAVRDKFLQDRLRSGPAVFGILGDLRHTPNHWSAQFVIEKVAPLLAQKKFTGTIQIVGKNASDQLVAAASPYPFIRFTGFIPDLTQFWNTLSGMLVPHIGGTGVRMKLLEALAYGVPILANTEAVLRLHQNLQASPLLTVFDQPAEWCDFLMQEKSFKKRYEAAELPIPKELQGREMYAFVNNEFLNRG